MPLAALGTVLAQAEPARGAPTQDLIPATIVAVILSLLVAALTLGHRSGRFTALARIGAFGERASGLPAWSAVPIAVVGASLVIAAFGFYWDVATHIDNGRDEGPFANPAHWFILVGLGGMALSGMLAVIIGTDERQPTSVRIAPGWHIPVGGVLLLLCGTIALLGFPLDDVWHRLFGQDVTMWGPTHIQMIAGASLATLGCWVLAIEGKRAARPEAADRAALTVRLTEPFLAGAFLIGLSTMQGEFDFGVPQFRLLFHPVLIALAAGMALVAARLRLGRGGALAAVAFFLAFRGVLALLIGPVLGRSMPHFPLYLVEALAVEAVALRSGRDRQLTLGLWAGLLIGTIGVAAEWAWSHAWMPIPWPRSLLPEAAVLGVIAGVAGGVLGGLIARALAPAEARQALPRGAGAWAGAAAVLCLVIPLPTSAPESTSAQVQLRDLTPAPERTVEATITVDPRTAADDAEWLTVTSWQGAEWNDQDVVIDHLERIDDSTWRTTEPIPVHGNWKAIVRLHHGSTLAALPIFMPEDEAIPADEVPATETFVRQFVSDKELLQREQTGGSAWLEWTAYLTILAIAVAWIGSMAWGLSRLEAAGSRARTGRRGGAPRTVPV